MSETEDKVVELSDYNNDHTFKEEKQESSHLVKNIILCIIAVLMYFGMMTILSFAIHGTLQQENYYSTPIKCNIELSSSNRTCTIPARTVNGIIIEPPRDINCTYLVATVRWDVCKRVYNHIFFDSQAYINNYNAYTRPGLECYPHPPQYLDCNDDNPFLIKRKPDYTFVVIYSIALSCFVCVGIVLVSAIISDKLKNKNQETLFL